MTDIALPAKSARNRHIADHLADVRAEIKTLEEEEAKLKAEIIRRIGPDDALGGDEWIAMTRTGSRRGGIDEAKLRAAGIDPDLYRKPDSSFVTVSVERREAEAA